jgi:hypothetical protein
MGKRKTIARCIDSRGTDDSTTQGVAKDIAFLNKQNDNVLQSRMMGSLFKKWEELVSLASAFRQKRLQS